VSPKGSLRKGGLFRDRIQESPSSICFCTSLSLRSFIPKPSVVYPCLFPSPEKEGSTVRTDTSTEKHTTHTNVSLTHGLYWNKQFEGCIHRPDHNTPQWVQPEMACSGNGRTSGGPEWHGLANSSVGSLVGNPSISVRPLHCNE